MQYFHYWKCCEIYFTLFFIINSSQLLLLFFYYPYFKWNTNLWTKDSALSMCKFSIIIFHLLKNTNKFVLFNLSMNYLLIWRNYFLNIELFIGILFKFICFHLFILVFYYFYRFTLFVLLKKFADISFIEVYYIYI